jgi:hypothetical protein
VRKVCVSAKSLSLRQPAIRTVFRRVSENEKKKKKRHIDDTDTGRQGGGGEN